MCSHTGTFKTRQKETFFPLFFLFSLWKVKRILCFLITNVPCFIYPPRCYALGVLQSRSMVGFQSLGCRNPLGHFKLWTFFQDVTHMEFKAGPLGPL